MKGLRKNTEANLFVSVSPENIKKLFGFLMLKGNASQ